MTIDMPMTATLTCDQCGKEVKLDLTELAGDWPSVGFDGLPEGWTGDPSEQFCPDCSEDNDV